MEQATQQDQPHRKLFFWAYFILAVDFFLIYVAFVR